MVNKKVFSLPNCITMLRIVGTMCLLFTEPLSTSFYIVYTLCGISDVLDGMIARMTKKTTELGSKLDSTADLLFYTVTLLKLIPLMLSKLRHILWYMVGIVLAIRLAAYFIAAIKYHKFASLHTYANKVTGFSVFTIPYMIQLFDAFIVCSVVCAIAGIASIEELFIHISSEKYNPGRKTLLKRI